MGHAHHFLSRLDRVSLPHVELALSLYRDHALLRHVLDRARMPEGAERVAIALEHPTEGPFLIVTREGRFVTCLGQGMRAGDLPVISRGQLEGIAAKVEDYRARVDARQKLLGPGGQTHQLLKRILDAGPELSREEFVAISSLQPLLALEFFRFMLDCGIGAHEARELLRKHVKRAGKLSPVVHPILESFWKQFWAIGHLAVLASMGGGELLDKAFRKEGEKPPERLISGFTMRWAFLAPALKGAYAIAKVGKPLLSTYKHAYAEAKDHHAQIEAGACLIALGARHARLRAEARKAIGRPASHESLHMATFARFMEQGVEIAFSEADAAASVQRQMGAGIAVKMGASAPAGSPFRFARNEDVPEDLAMSLAVNAMNDYSPSFQNVVPLFVMIPWAARAAPEQLYLPQAWIDAVHPPLTPARVLHFLRGWIQEVRRPAPPKKPDGPARQGPCPCGSGKKYKRCCGQ